MPTAEEILVKVRELREYAGQPAGSLARLLFDQESDDQVFAETANTLSFLPTLTGQQIADLRAFLATEAPGLTVEPALREAARAIKSGPQPRFWKALFVLLKALRQTHPHLRSEFE